MSTVLPRSRRRTRVRIRRASSDGMQADGGLVADVEHAHEAGADLGREPDALGLAAGERRRAAVERQVVEADLDEEVEAGADLLDDLVGDHLLRARELRVLGREAGEPLLGVDDAQRSRLGDVLVADLDGARLGLEAGALAGGAGHRGHVALELLAHVLGVGVLVAAGQVGDRRPRTWSPSCWCGRWSPRKLTVTRFGSP